MAERLNLTNQHKLTLLEALKCYGTTVLLMLVCIFLCPEDPAKLGVLCMLPIIYLLLYALIFKRVLEGMLMAILVAYAMTFKAYGLLNPIVDGLQRELTSPDLVSLILLVSVVNILMTLLEKVGCMDAIVEFVLKHCKSKKSVKVWTWILAWPLFLDDYMHILTVNNAMKRVYDEYEIPREELGLISHAMCGQLRLIIPISSWTAFLTGLFDSSGFVVNGSAMKAFLYTIPFDFYVWVSVFGALLFALGIFPKLGKMKECTPYIEEKTEEDEGEENGEKKRGNLFDFCLPIALVVAGLIYFDFDLLRTFVIVLPVTFIYYLFKGYVDVEKMEETIVEGCQNMMVLFLLFLFSYMLISQLEVLGFMDYVIEIGTKFVNPLLLPFILFVMVSVIELAIGLGWGMLLLIFPVAIPLAESIGANTILCGAALLSAVTLGSNGCVVCDYTTMTAGALNMKNYQHTITQLPFIIVCGVISATLFLVTGFVWQ